MAEYIDLGEIRAAAYAQAGAGSVIYVHASKKDPEPVMALAGPLDSAVVWMEGAVWERDLTPWPAERAFRRGEDYTGGAGEYLQKLSDNMRKVEQALGINPVVRALVGYSLGGLFSLYCSYLTDAYPVIGSISGSMWYDGFREYAASHTCRAKYVYISLGRGESHNKNPRFSTVAESTGAVKEALEKNGVKTRFEWTGGDHRRMVHERIAAGLRAMDSAVKALHLNINRSGGT
ncbi:MAG: hypothetical protein IKE62_00945 [Oscillospiraceae bacterium]|nr:hypothetical protein [Oscillospiraceae bacterium]